MKTAYRLEIVLFIVSTALFLFGCNTPAVIVAPDISVENPTEPTETADVDFTLQTIINDGGLAYIGVGGEIDGVINPDLVVQPGTVVHLVLLNGDGMPHDLFLPDFDMKTSLISKIGARAELIFEVEDMQPGTYVYYCTVPGHRQAGQEGKLIVTAP